MKKINLTSLFLVSLLMIHSCKMSKDKTASRDKTVYEDEVIMMDESSEGFAAEDVEGYSKDVYIEADEYAETPYNNNRSGSSEQKLEKNIRNNFYYKSIERIDDNYYFFCESGGESYGKPVGIADVSGNVILPNLFQKNYNSSREKEDVILSLSKSFGLFNLASKSWKIPMIYENLYYLDGSNSQFFIAKKDNKKGLINSNNEVITPFTWSEIESINGIENLLFVSENHNKRGVFNILSNKLSIPTEYENLRKVKNTNYFYGKKDNKYHFLDANNQQIFKNLYDEMLLFDTYMVVKKDALWGVIDYSENIMVPFEYLEFSTYPFNDGSFLVKNKEGKYGCILSDGKITLPFEYDNIDKNSYSKTIISKKNGKCGLVMVNSGNPKEIVTCEYDSIAPKNDLKCFIIKQKGKYGILDLTGKIIIEANFDAIEIMGKGDSYSYDSECYFKVVKDGNCNLYSSLGRPVFQETFADIQFIKSNENEYGGFSYSNYIKLKNKNGKYAIADKLGTVLTKYIFDDILLSKNFVAIVKSKDKYGIYSLIEKKMMLDFTYDSIIFSSGKYYGINKNIVDLLQINAKEIVVKPTVN